MTSFLWNEGDTMMLISDLWKLGYSGNQILKRLHVDHNGTLPTRSALMGKLHRMGIHHEGILPKPSKRLYVRKVPYKPRAVVTAIEEPVKKAKPLPSLIKLPEQCTIDQLTEHSCRWPFGDDPRTMRYCGRKVVEVPSMSGKSTFRSYCIEHFQKAMVGGTKREISP